jgi:hypothetical protein
MERSYLIYGAARKILYIGSKIVFEVFALKRLPVIIVILLITSVCVIPTQEVSGASEAIGVNLIVNNFLNNSQAKAISWVVFDGQKPSQSQVDNVTFKWYNPRHQLVFTDNVDPDEEAVAWSYFNVSQLGYWSVNVTYQGNTSFWNNKSFEVVPAYWGPGVYFVRGTTLVSFNSTLTIAPGTTIKFNEGKGLGVEGKLVAKGNASDPIIFTSNLTTKTPGDWSSITFFKSADNDSAIDNVKIEYSREGLTLMETSVLVTNSTFTNNKERAIYAEHSNSTFSNNHISKGEDGISPWGIRSSASNLTLESNIIQNMYIGLYLINSNESRNASIFMQNNLVEHCDSYGMFVKNSLIYSQDDRFVGNNKGVLIDSKTEAVFENLEISGGLEGFTASENSSAIIWNSSVEIVDIATFVLSGGSLVDLINCSFSTIASSPGVSIDSADDSILSIRNFLKVQTISYDNGSVISNAMIRVYDGVQLLYQGNTDSFGLTPNLIVTDRIYKPSLIENVTRIYVTLGELSFQNNNRSVAMNTSHTEIFLGSVNEFNESDTIPPFVISHYPYNDDDVSLNVIVTISFSEPMQQNTAQENFSISPPVAGTFTWTGDTLIFIPQSLTSNTFYTVEIGTGAKDLANNSILSTYQFSFTTTYSTDLTPPRIIGVSPTGVDVPVDIPYINITFSKDMQTFSTEPAFSIEPRVPGLFSWDGRTLRFQPAFDLTEETTYKVKINGSRASDTTGLALDGNVNGISEGSPNDDYIWQFRTKRSDFTPPKITRGYPTGSMVDLDTTMRIYFNEGMNITTVQEAFSFTNGTVTYTSDSGTWGKTIYILTFTPNDPLNYSTLYTVTIRGTAQDLHGNGLDGNGNGVSEGSPIDDYSFSFRTIYDPNLGLPMVSEVFPWGSGAGIEAEILINFSQQMNQPSVEGAITITDGFTTWGKDDGFFIWEDNWCTFITYFDLDYFTKYTVGVNNTAKNIVDDPLDGNENGIIEDHTLDAYFWNFTTGGPSELSISYVSVEGVDALNQSRVWFVDSGGIVQIGVNITNIGHSDIYRDFRVSLRNISGLGEPMNITISSLYLYQDTGTLIFPWPAPTAIGDHFVEIIIDWVDEIYEVNEDNNTFLIHFAVGPDYIPLNLTVNAMDATDPDIVWYVDYGLPVEIGVKVRNIGFSGVSSGINYSIAFWNSTDSGTPIGPSPFQFISGLPGLGTNDSSNSQYGYWYIPKVLGEFYITILIDYNDSTVEIDEGNNRFVLHLAFSPDYTFSNMLVNGNDANDRDLFWNATSSEPVLLGVNITNIGPSGLDDSIPYNLSFYNSTNRGTPLEESFYSINPQGLLSGEDSGEFTVLWLPPNAEGDYYVAVIIDPVGELPEENENNNVFVIHFRIGPDIIISKIVVNGEDVIKSPSSPIYIGSQDNVTILANVSNLGFSGTGSDFYLALFNGTRMGEMNEGPYLNLSVSALSAIEEPGSDSGDISLYWISSSNPGTYFVILYADISDLCKESKEGNNLWILTFVISPDLVPNNITIDGIPISSYSEETVIVLPGQTFIIGANVSNRGESSSGSLLFAMSFYNSTSSGTNLEPDFAQWLSLGPLDAGGYSMDLYSQWTSPSPQDPTDYYINISVDSIFSLPETNELNNYYILHIRVDGPDLTPNKIGINTPGDEFSYIYEDPFALDFISEEISIPLGVDISITFDVRNIGGVGQSQGTNVTFYNTSGLLGPASSAPFFETLPFFVLLNGKNSPSSDETNEVGQTITAQWSNPGIPGIWYVNITIDMGNNLLEFSESNNTFTLILNVTDFPATSISTDGTSFSGPVLYVTSSTQMGFNVSGGNPPFYTWYRIIDLGTNATLKFANYTMEGTTFNITWGEGAYKIEYNSTDSMGNFEKVRYKIVVVDDSQPQTQIILGDPKYRLNPTHIFNITSKTSISFNPEDLPQGGSFWPSIQNASGIESTYFRIQNLSSGLFLLDWTQTQEGGEIFLDNPLWNDGLYRIWFNSTDNLNQEEASKYVDVYLDNNGPTISILLNNPKHPHPSLDWFVSLITTFVIDSQESNGSQADISSSEVNIVFDDGGISSGWIKTNTFDLYSIFWQGDGNYTIQYRSYDNLGNSMDYKVIHVYVDDTPPELAITVGDPKYREFISDLYNVSSETSINLTEADGSGSQTKTLEFRIFNATYDSGWTAYSGEFNLSGLNQGFYGIEYLGNDNMGNFIIMGIEVYLDISPPETSIEIGEAKHRESPADVWNITSDTPILVLFVGEMGSGLAYMQFRVQNLTYDSGWNNITVDFYLDASLSDGLYNISYRGVDQLGNSEMIKTILIRLDNFGPDSIISVSNIYGGYVNTLSIFEKSANDSYGSGIKTIWHRIFGNKTKVYYTGWLSSNSFSLSPNLLDGQYIIEYYAVDNLSNSGPLNYLLVYLDSTPPDSNIVISDPKYRLRESDLWRIAAETSFTLEGTDGLGAGIGIIYYSVINNFGIPVVSSNPYSSPFNLSGLGGEGIYKIRIWAEDNLGNLESQKDMYVILDNTPPKILSSQPTGSGNSINSFIQIEFSEEMDHDKVKLAFSYTNGIQVWDSLSGFFNWNGNVMSFYPYEKLLYGTLYTVEINTTATDNVDYNLDGDGDGIFEGTADIYTWTFRIRNQPDLIPPFIISVTPSDNTQNVQPSARIIIEFSEIMDELSVEAALAFSDGIHTYNSSFGSFQWMGNTTIFTPSEPFIFHTQYTFLIGGQARDPLGNFMTASYSWSFTTQTDNIPPLVLQHSPTGNNVLVRTNITVTFNEPMNTGSFENGIVLAPEVNGSYRWEGNTLILTPDEDMKYSTEYFVTVGIGLSDVAGNPIENLFFFTFITEPDTYPPSVISHSPSGDEVDINLNLTVTFSEAMNHSSVENAFSISPSVLGSFSWNGTTLIFSPSEFINNTVYTATIGIQAKDVTGNFLSEPYQFSFTTKVDPYGPYIIEVAPHGDNVPIDSEIIMRFNEAIDINSLNRAFVVEPNIPGSFTIEVNNIVVFTPNVKLTRGTTYNVTITIEAEDLAGNRMPHNYSWEFTTEEAEVSSASPFAYDVLFFWIFLVIILIIALLAFYEFYIRRRRREEEENGDSELEMPDDEEPEEIDFDDDDMVPLESDEGAEDIQGEPLEDSGESEGYSEEGDAVLEDESTGEEGTVEEVQHREDGSDEIEDILRNIEKENGDLEDR